jgi:hypothetical protein
MALLLGIIGLTAGAVGQENGAGKRVRVRRRKPEESRE